jgi:hypothetical protein
MRGGERRLCGTAWDGAVDTDSRLPRVLPVHLPPHQLSAVRPALSCLAKAAWATVNLRYSVGSGICSSQPARRCLKASSSAGQSVGYFTE